MNRRGIQRVYVVLFFSVVSGGLLQSCSSTGQEPDQESGEISAPIYEDPPSADYQATYQEWYAERAYPRGVINWDTYKIGAREKKGLGFAPPPMNLWEYLGPTNWDVHPTSEGQGPPPTQGRINAVAYHPDHPDQILYAASAAGGVWETFDGGNKWHPLSDAWPELWTSSIAIDPDNPDRIYVGTGDFPGQKGRGFGLMISENGGTTWTAKKGVLNSKDITDIVIDPDDPDRVTVATARSTNTHNYVYLSENGPAGPFLKAIDHKAYWTDLAVGRSVSGRAGDYRYTYATGTNTDDVSNTFWRSQDSGATWVELLLPFNAGQERRVAVAPSPTDGNTVYVSGSTTATVYKSETGGGFPWEDITGGLANETYAFGQDFYDFRLHPFLIETQSGTKDGLLFARIDTFLYNGQNWKSIGGAYDEDLLHVDAHAFASHPDDPTELLLTNDGGVYRYSYDPDEDEGTAVSLGAKLGCALVSKLNVHPYIDYWVMGGTQDNGTAFCLGDKKRWYTLVAGDTGFTAISQVYPDYQYAAKASQLGKKDGNVFIQFTDNHGYQFQDWQTITTFVGDEPMRHGTPIVIDTFDHKSLYFAGNYLHRYDADSGQWHNQIGNQDLSVDGYVNNMDIAPGGQWIYVGTNKGEVWVTPNRGQNWKRVDTSFSDPLPDRSIAVLSVDPYNPERVLVGQATTWFDGTGYNLWECKDVTANPPVWESVQGMIPDVLPQGPVNAIARHPTAPSTHWYVGTDLGCFGTEDAGETWFSMHTGLPNVPVTDLKTRKLGGYLYACTWGRGFWRIRLPHIPQGQIKNN